MMKKVFYLFLFCTTVLFGAAGFNMNKYMKEMKKSFKCVSGKAGVLDKCDDELKELENLQSHLAACKSAANTYYQVLFKQRLIPQVPNEADLNKAFDEISDKLKIIKTAIENKDTALRAKTVDEIQALIKKAHNNYKPDM